MKLRRLWMLVSVTNLASFVPAIAQEPQLPKGFQAVGADHAADLQKLCRATADTGLFSGAVLVSLDGRVIYKDAFGLANREWNIPNTTDTKFRLASVSKQFCSMLVLQLIQEGRINLEDTITDHLPYYRKDTGQLITIHHLLSHQSGIKDFTSAFDYRQTVSRLSFEKDDFIKLHCSGDLIHEPGTLYSYCNAGYCILGRIIEKVTHKTFEQNLHQRIFEPLGMNNSGYDRNHKVIEKRASGYTRGPFEVKNAAYMDMDSSPGAAGSLYSTVEDMFLWDRALYTDKLLNQKYRDIMFTPNSNVPEVKAAGGRPQSVYGYGWQIVNRTHPVTKHRTKLIKHGGAINGFRAMEIRLPEDNAFVIVLCNQSDPVGSSRVWNAVLRLGDGLVDIVTGQPFRLPGPPPVPQEQRMYRMVLDQNVETAIEWFRTKGKKAAWGGTNFAVAEQLLKVGRIEDGLRLMELEIELTPKKVWVLRKTARAHLDCGFPERALDILNQALTLKPDDESLLGMKVEAEQALERD